MRVVRTSEDIEGLLRVLREDLSGGDVVKVARLPQPRVGERYRDIVKSIFANAGAAQVVVVLETRDRVKKIFVFLLRSEPSEAAKGYLDCPVVVDGYLVEVRGDELLHREYSPRRYKDARELLDRIEDMANLYRLSEERLRRERIELADFYDWMLVGG